MTQPLVIAKSGELELALLPALANRHGLITGATGTGKTVTLQVLAERLSAIGVPVFMADVKGDLSGLGAAGSLTPKLKARLDSLGIEAPAPAAFPAVFWDVFGEAGHPVRATVSDMGPLLLGRLLNLNDPYLLLLDLEDYLRCQKEVGELYRNQPNWVRKSILNVARMGKFSSDRTIREYARDIWGIPVD